MLGIFCRLIICLTRVRIFSNVLRYLMAIFVCVSVQITFADSQEQSILMMPDTGGHQALINSITFTPDGRFLVSAGNDKLVRIWDWQKGKVVRTIRGLAGSGHVGEIFAMALSPNGRWLVVGGWLGADPAELGSIRLYDFASGELKALLKGHNEEVSALSISPNSERLISGSGSGTVIIWDLEKAQPLRKIEAHKDEISSVTFSADGTRVITASYDKTLRMWNVAKGDLLREMRGHGDKIHSIAQSPIADIVVSGDLSGEIRLWNAKTGRALGIFANQGGPIGSLRFSRDGKLLLVTCAYSGCEFKQRVFDVATKNVVQAYSNHDNIVKASAFAPAEMLVATGGGNNHEIHIWDPRTGETKARLAGIGRPVWVAAFSKDSHWIAWGQSLRSTATKNLGQLETLLSVPLTINDPIGEPAPIGIAQEFVLPQTNFGAFTLRHRRGSSLYSNNILEILRDGKVQTRIIRGAGDGFGHNTYTFTPDGQAVISGGDGGVIAAYDLDGRKIGNFVGHEGDVFAVAASPDGNFLISGSADQTIRLWGLKSRALLVTLSYGANGEWVMWTPEGFYTSSKDGAKIVGWQVNRGPDKASDYVNGEQVREAFFRPDLVAEKINGDPSGRVRAAAAKINIEDIVKSGIAPDVKITKIEVLEKTETPFDVAETVVKVNVTAQIVDRGGGIGDISWYINDQVIGFSEINDLDARHEITGSFELANPKSKIQVVARNKSGKIESKSDPQFVEVDEKTLKGVPNLYVLAIGVNKYRDSDYKLSLAVSDAQTLAASIVDAGKDYYRTKPQLTMLIDEDVTAEKLEAVFTELGSKVRATDVFLFFIAGHGKSIDGDYYFVPPDVTEFTDETIKDKGFGKTHWRRWFAKIPAQKSIFIFDTCDSGSVSQVIASLPTARGAFDAAFEAAQQRLKDATGRTLFTASSNQQSALEGYKNHGLLTYTILEGLAKAGGENPLITLTDLKDYVEDKVRVYSKEMRACPVVRQQEYCQKPKVILGEHNYALVPRYKQILAIIDSGTETYSRIPTHVVIAVTDLRQTLRGEGTISQLTPGTSITLVKIEGDYAYIAKDGTAIGYVLLDKLLKLN